MYRYMLNFLYVAVIKSGARCIDDLVDLVTKKSSSRVVLGGLQPSQSYLVTAAHQWSIAGRQGGAEHYSITQVGYLQSSVVSNVHRKLYSSLCSYFYLYRMRAKLYQL